MRTYHWLPGSRQKAWRSINCWPRYRGPKSRFRCLVIEHAAMNLLPTLLTAEAARRKLPKPRQRWTSKFVAGPSQRRRRAARMCWQHHCCGASARSQAHVVAIDYLDRLRRLRPLVAERASLLAKLALVAPGYAGQIAQRVPPHHTASIPGDVAKAWTWRQLHDMLVEHDKLDAQELQQQIGRKRRTLREVTAELIDVRAWGVQLQRLQHNNPIAGPGQLARHRQAPRFHAAARPPPVLAGRGAQVDEAVCAGGTGVGDADIARRRKF